MTMAVWCLLYYVSGPINKLIKHSIKLAESGSGYSSAHWLGPCNLCNGSALLCRCMYHVQCSSAVKLWRNAEWLTRLRLIFRFHILQAPDLSHSYAYVRMRQVLWNVWMGNVVKSSQVWPRWMCEYEYISLKGQGGGFF